MNTLPDRALKIAPGMRLQWEEAQQAHVLLYPEGMVQLNPSSAEILGRCDGQRDAETIVAELEREFPDADPGDDVREFLAIALANGWIVPV